MIVTSVTQITFLIVFNHDSLAGSIKKPATRHISQSQCSTCKLSLSEISKGNS